MTWDEIIIQLKEWQADPAQLADESEGLDAPTAEAFRSAIDFARLCGRLGVKDSLRVVSCGDGGLGFEWQYKHQPRREFCEFDEDGGMTSDQFINYIKTEPSP